MREIKISKKNIIASNVDDVLGLEEFSSGLEGIIYLYRDSNYYDKDVLLKYIRPFKHFVEYDVNVSLDMMENKRKKIELITNMKCFENEIKILDAGYEFGEFRGFTMEKCPYNRINLFATTKTKIKYLKIIKEKLELFNANNVYIGDFNPTNFLTNRSQDKIKMCDLDNLKINDIDFDVKHRFVRVFNGKCNKKEYIDSFCFNLFTLALLNKYRNSYVLDNLDKCPLPKDFDNSKNREIIESMIHLDNSYKKKYILDNINL